MSGNDAELPNLLGAFRAQATASHLLGEARSLDAVMPPLLEGLGEALGFELATLWCVSDDAERLTCSEHVGDGRALRFSAATETGALRRGECHAGIAWMDEDQSWGEDVRTLALAPRRAIAAAEGVHTVVATPIFAGGAVRAVLELATYDLRPFEETTSIALTAVAAQIGQLLERELIEERYYALSAMLEQQVYESAIPVAIPLAA